MSEKTAEPYAMEKTLDFERKVISVDSLKIDGASKLNTAANRGGFAGKGCFVDAFVYQNPSRISESLKKGVTNPFFASITLIYWRGDREC